MSLLMKDEYYKPIEDDLRKYFMDLYWKDILSLLDDPSYRLNSSSAVLEAIRKGSVYYKDGIFSGSFNVRISNELSKYAEFNGRSKVWKGRPPADIQAAAVIANSKGEALNKAISSRIADIPSRVEEAIKSITYPIEPTLEAMSQQAGQDLKGIGLSAEITPELSDRLINNYTQNMDRNIVNWTVNQTERMRDMVEQNVLSGYSRIELRKQIMNEYGVTMTKARFLARQETSLFLVEVRDNRYQSAGIEKFKWSATGGKTGDGRTREWHKKLHGQIFLYSSPPIIDPERGETGLPGQAFGCRCTAIPVI